MKSKFILGLGLMAFIIGCKSPKTEVTPEEARAIGKEAYIYANPLVDSFADANFEKLNSALTFYK